MLEVRQLGSRYGRIPALHDVSLRVGAGELVALVGANGAGKSTLMRTVAGILPPTSGRVEVHGRVSTLLSLGIGFNRKLTGRQNVVLGGLAAGLTRAELAARNDVLIWGRDGAAMQAMDAARENTHYLPGFAFPAALRVSRAASIPAHSAIKGRKSHSCLEAIRFRLWPTRTARLLEARWARA